MATPNCAAIFISGRITTNNNYEKRKNLHYYNIHLFIKRKQKMKKILVLFTALLLFSCKTIQYVPIKGDTIVKDSLIIETRIDTLKVQLPPERVRDWTGLLDTLRLETGYAYSTSWVDTTKGILAGELKNKETPLEFHLPSTHTLEKKDSIIYQEIPYRVEITKEKKVYPKWLVLLSILGVISTLILGFEIYLKVKRK